MARKNARRFNLRKVRINSFVLPAALVAGGVVAGSITDAVTSPLRIVSARLTYNMSDVPQVSDDGHEFGLAHGDYTAAEVKECLDASGGINKNDKIAMERTNRLVRTIGTMAGQQSVDGGRSYNQGEPEKTKLNWYVGVGETLAIWIRNSSDTTWASGSNLNVLGTLWVKDSV